MPEYIREAVGAILALTAMGVIAYAAVMLGVPEAQAALYAVVGAAVGYYLRGRVTSPNP